MHIETVVLNCAKILLIYKTTGALHYLHTEVKIFKPRNKLHFRERQAIKELKQNTNINIKKADKGTTTVKPRPNDRNISTQHIATLLGATCCVRLATVLRCVATCWVLLAQI